jgi:hypothetical protein
MPQLQGQSFPILFHLWLKVWPLHACAKCFHKQYLLQSLDKLKNESEILHLLAKVDNCQFFMNTQKKYEACPESKDTSRVSWQGNFLCLLWQHCRRPWSFTCEPCSFDSGRTGFVGVRRVWNGSTDPKSHQMRGAFHHMISQCKRWMSRGNSQTNCCCLW